MNRSSGVLMHITSLPGPFGIGCLGKEAINFSKLIHEAGFTHWQVLPFSYPGLGDSPYISFSAFAGNHLLIDPRFLHKKGLISESDVDDCRYKGSAHAVDYQWVKKNRERMLARAYENANRRWRDKVVAFVKQHPWVRDVALFQTIQAMNGRSPWWAWSDPALRHHDRPALAAIEKKRHKDYLFYCFVQYIFDLNWQDVKDAIHAAGVFMIGDIPIYVSSDSADVWANRHLFQVTKEGVFHHVAGVPPDYFTLEGQLWGNPLYAWDRHVEDDYAWWMARLSHNFLLFDKVRIDHFRAFYNYWRIPAKAKTAIEGEWAKGPGMPFIRTVKKNYPDAPIIAEDLGSLDARVSAFVKRTGFPGMRVFQFAFDSEDDNEHLPHNYEHDCVAYTGTHDNDTLLGWIWNQEEKTRRYMLAYCRYVGSDWGRGGPDSDVCRQIICHMMQSHAGMVIFPIQDILGYGSDTRMNIPGSPEGNWTFRLSHAALSGLDKKGLAYINHLYRRKASVLDFL